jgi:hypothetical protein
MPSIKIECSSCGGTGLYCGFCEAKGTAVVCQSCAGQGWQNFSYKEFTGRKRRAGVRTISISRGSFIATGVGAVAGTQMTYEEFEKKVPVKR